MPRHGVGKRKSNKHFEREETEFRENEEELMIVWKLARVKHACLFHNKQEETVAYDNRRV